MIFTKTFVFVGLLGVAFCSPLSWKNDQRCGIKGPSSSSARHGLGIVGGTNASLGEFPWQAALAYNDDASSNRFEQTAGATIIHKRWVLTTGFWATFNTNGNGQFQDIKDIQVWGGMLIFCFVLYFFFIN